MGFLWDIRSCTSCDSLNIEYKQPGNIGDIPHCIYHSIYILYVVYIHRRLSIRIKRVFAFSKRNIRIFILLQILGIGMKLALPSSIFHIPSLDLFSPCIDRKYFTDYTQKPEIPTFL
ncbi:hypothetical protein LOTGIDRAFT_154781 [Lottia gigantea]|uniref:Uncharacterized protein n=1 Tax=Lottia gigantea TaxID=225164 RepID=V3Z8P0_LOTGI|nr:hypothetical protein LOTGIDRAFT_154781 [Lottia gigantea]ESO87283.1 hypothetical protein LOTGIDRAFT_154781 [Lottia gigantea]